MRTIIYVDGFNLYFGALKGTPYKWLDLKCLFTKILEPHNQIVCIKYFTAPVSGNLSDPDKATHQSAYLAALKHCTPEMRIYFGQFTTHEITAKLVTPILGQRHAKISRTTEKGSDVNLAVHLLNDAWLDAYDCAIVVSGDSDLAEAMRLVKTHHQKIVGVIVPGKRGMSKELIQLADFVRKIRTSALAGSQFPAVIPNTNIHKPSDW